MSDYGVIGSESAQQPLPQISLSNSVMEEELQEKTAMFRDFLTSRVKMINFIKGANILSLTVFRL